MSACPVGTDVSHAARTLRAGGLVAFATETVYGLGANALDNTAIARIFAAKERPAFDPLIVHLADAGDVSRVTTEFPALAQQLAEHFWPGPLTLVLPKTAMIGDLVTSDLPNVAIRVPGHEQARQLIAEAGVPIAAPSANLFGRLSPTTAQHVADQLGERIDYILDGGPCRVGIESTVVSLCDAKPVLLRPGGVTIELLEDVIGPVQRLPAPVDTEPQAPPSPGMLSQHYAPLTPLRVIDTVDDIPPAEQSTYGLLARVTPDTIHRFSAVEILSETGDLTEAASRLFAALRRLDASDIQRIAALRLPDEGLGRAINDRLDRASQR